MQLQFYNQSHKHLAVCEWKFKTGQWFCTTADNQKIHCSSTRELKKELASRGYTELSMQEESWTERREYPRKRVKTDYRIFLETKPTRPQLQPINVSRGGALMTSPIQVKRGSEVALSVKSGAEKTQKVRAIIRHSTINEELHHFVVGLEFSSPISENEAIKQ